MDGKQLVGAWKLLSCQSFDKDNNELPENYAGRVLHDSKII